MSNSPDWKKLVDLALGTPPQSDELRFKLDTWSQAFEREFGRCPETSDFPDPLAWFFWRLTNADTPLGTVAWAEQFHEQNGHYPARDELPEELRPATGKGIGRPLKACTPWVQARKAWREASARCCYEGFRGVFDTLKAIGTPSLGYQFKESELSSAHGGSFNAESIAGEKPAQLAIELTGVYFGVADETARDLVFPKRRKKGTTG